jgi:hypothetical protein
MTHQNLQSSPKKGTKNPKYHSPPRKSKSKGKEKIKEITKPNNPFGFL